MTDDGGAGSYEAAEHFAELGAVFVQGSHGFQVEVSYFMGDLELSLQFRQ